MATLTVKEKKKPQLESSEIDDNKGLMFEKKIGESVGEHGIYYGDRGVYDRRNKLNDLTGKEWAQFTRSWFTHNPEPRKDEEILHPAKFPESMIAEFVHFFTKKGDVVLDPMAGTGSTLVACDLTNRKGIGVELIDKWAKIASGRTKQEIITGDALELSRIWNERGLPSVDFCITSPPYWNMLRQSRGHVESTAKQRKKEGLDVFYSDNPKDIGNVESYEDYLEKLYAIYSNVHTLLKPEKYLVVIVQNVRTPTGEMIPLAWDLARKLSTLYTLRQERIWCQNNKMLGIWGYPSTYVSNVHHHYCLVFQKGES